MRIIKVDDAKKQGWRGPFYPEQIDKLNDHVLEYMDNDDMNQLELLGKSILIGSSVNTLQTSDGYNWLGVVTIPYDVEGSFKVYVRFAFSWKAKFIHKEDKEKTKRSIAIYYSRSSKAGHLPPGLLNDLTGLMAEGIKALYGKKA